MIRPTAALAAALFLTALFFPAAASVAGQPGRFFLMGSGSLNLVNLRNGQTAQVNLLNEDGTLREAALDEVDRVFGYPSKETGEHISPRLLFMLSYFADFTAPGKPVLIESAYRSPDYNDNIRRKGANAARTSTHIDGMALDFRIEGVDGKQLWEQIRSMNCCGAGHYGGDTVHLDAGRPRFWEAATSGTGSTEPDYNRHLYLSTDFDRYPAQAPIRLSFSGVSTFGFGVRSTADILEAGPIGATVAGMILNDSGSSDCLLIPDRSASRFLQAALPAELPAGRYRIKLTMCSRPFEQMPVEAVSSEIELY